MFAIEDPQLALPERAALDTTTDATELTLAYGLASYDAVHAAQLVEALPVEPAGTQRELSFVGLGSSTSGRRARDADELLADGFGRD